ncbi:FkbM family methyltransferase [Psychroserpens sp. SPM9]|uniref:FkbM family methyltransferase n=1 Tax=Psychroserpens sp. SPM9 TaxID=2975598 RepID=UPI0021A46FD7|nr:FkbM family methyltransferase [Psychroserpens sp. SPM9]MDG5492231.1 FkbM family methyltransferase [Psychroserpens sp. SPM9]
MNFKKIKTKLSRLINKNESNMTQVLLCGKSLKVLKNSFRLKEDQDDAWWFYLTQNHDVIYDIGCNVGYTALLALIQNPNRSILLVDPNPTALQKAATNLIHNGLSNKAFFMPAFVSDAVDETVKFYTIGSGAAGSMYASHAQSAAAINSFMEVKTVTLDYLYSFYGLKPDLVKIDVEGAETMVMQASKVLAKEAQCSFFIEMHNVENLGMEAAGQLMLDWCKEMSYRAWYLKTGSQLLTAETIKDRGKCHLLLLPSNQEYPAYLKGILPNSPLPKSM